MLPTIADYTLPAAAREPDNRVQWDVDPSRAMLLVHDMQQYFIDAYGDESTVADRTVGNIRRLRSAAESAGVPVCFTAQPPKQDPSERGLLWDFWGPGIQDDGRHAIIDSLGPVDDADVITKWRYDAFVRTDLATRLRDAGRDQLVVTGVYAHIGCLMTATSAFMHDIQPFLIADATADFSADHHAMALQYAADRCAVVTDTDSVEARFLAAV